MHDQYDLGRVVAIYDGSDGDATLALYKALEALGPIGHIATNIFRAQKSSARAKVYRGANGRGRYRGMAYDRKAWAMDNLDKSLFEHAETLGVSWGWGIDANQPKHKMVLYVELPTGQVSFHTEARGKGPDFPGQWDGVRDVAPERVCRFVANVLTRQHETPAWQACRGEECRTMQRCMADPLPCSALQATRIPLNFIGGMHA